MWWYYNEFEIIGGMLLMCQNTPIQVYGAWIQTYYILCSKTYSSFGNVWLVRDKPLGAPTSVKLVYSFHTWHSTLLGESLDIYSFPCSYYQLWLCGDQMFAQKGFQNFVAPWPSCGQNNAGIFPKTKFSEGTHLCNTHNNGKIGIFVGYFWVRQAVITVGYVVPIYRHSLLLFGNIASLVNFYE